MTDLKPGAFARARSLISIGLVLFSGPAQAAFSPDPYEVVICCSEKSYRRSAVQYYVVTRFGRRFLFKKPYQGAPGRRIDISDAEIINQEGRMLSVELNRGAGGTIKIWGDSREATVDIRLEGEGFEDINTDGVLDNFACENQRSRDLAPFYFED
jgi:hypothetical protein